jgi:hypothetical protein
VASPRTDRPTVQNRKTVAAVAHKYRFLALYNRNFHQQDQDPTPERVEPTSSRSLNRARTTVLCPSEDDR